MRVTTASSQEHGNRGHALPSPNHYLRRRRRAARAEVVMVAAQQGNVFSRLLLLVFCFVFRRKRRRLRNPKIQHTPKTRNHLKFTTLFFFSNCFCCQKIYKNLGQRNQIRNHVKFTLNFFLNFPTIFFSKITKICANETKQGTISNLQLIFF